MIHDHHRHFLSEEVVRDDGMGAWVGLGIGLGGLRRLGTVGSFGDWRGYVNGWVYVYIRTCFPFFLFILLLFG